MNRPTSVIVMSLLLTACMPPAIQDTKSIVEYSGQSHFDYPNANVIPLGPVKAQSVIETTKGTSFATRQEAIHKAIEQKNGDLLIDYFVSLHKADTKRKDKDKKIIYRLTYTAEGVAAKMEIGKKRLH